MRRTEIREESPRRVTLGHRLLRLVVGIIVTGHALEKLGVLRSFQAELGELGLPNPQFVAVSVLTIELLVGVGLIIGRFTRIAAFALLCDQIAAAMMLGSLQQLWSSRATAESILLLGAAAICILAESRAAAAHKPSRWQALVDDMDDDPAHEAVYLDREAELLDRRTTLRVARRPDQHWRVFSRLGTSRR